jgi:pimeloyl-ACP methyl ester carboxylesterase
VQTNAANLGRFIEASDADVIHIVAHSLGGLLVRQLLHDAPEVSERIGRIVMLGAPHNGSEVAHRLAMIPLLHKLMGRSYACGLDGLLPPWADGPETGVIAGNRPFGFGMLLGRLSGANDGTVTVAETRLSGANRHIVLPVTHMGMQFSRLVAGQVCTFLKNGHFAATEDRPV